MNKAVIIQQHEILCGLGTLNESSNAILCGKSAIIEGPCFNIPVAFAPFADTSFRNLCKTATFLKSRINDNFNKQNLLFIYCAAKGDISTLEPQKPETADPASPLLGEQAYEIAAWMGLKPSRTLVLSSACASGAAAVETAKELLENGAFSTAVIFGYDVISHFVTSGFHSLSALSPEGAKPFDKNRNGLTLGDGAALAVLTFGEPRAGDIIVAGSGSSNDANHRTGPSRTGDGLFRAASAALDNALLWKPVTGAVKCHGTATVYNDAMEAKAISRLFSTIPQCFSVKGAIGHTSGAGSLIEILLASSFLKLRTAPPTAGFEVLGVDEQIPVSGSARKFDGDSILCLSAGFGGLNCAVVLKEYN